MKEKFALFDLFILSGLFSIKKILADSSIFDCVFSSDHSALYIQVFLSEAQKTDYLEIVTSIRFIVKVIYENKI